MVVSVESIMSAILRNISVNSRNIAFRYFTNHNQLNVFVEHIPWNWEEWTDEKKFNMTFSSGIDIKNWPLKNYKSFFCLACHYCMMCVQLLFLYFWSLWSFIIHGHKGQKKFGMCRFCNYCVLLIRPSLDFINSLRNYTLKTSPQIDGYFM